jgi:hypothetical protein
MLSTTIQQAISIMAACTVRRVLAAWKAQVVEISALRATETEQLCKLRIQEARKTEIASKFHRVWQLHSALKAWQTAARESACTRAAHSQAVLQEAAIAARMEIAAQFHNHFQLHASMDAWRRAASCLRQKRQAVQQAEVVQSRIDAVLARVRAGKLDGKSHWARVGAADHGKSTNHSDATGACSEAAEPESRQEFAAVGTSAQQRPTGSSPRSACSTDQGPGCSHSAVEGGLQTLQNVQASQRASAAAPAQSSVPTANVQDMQSKQDDLTPFPETESTAVADSGAIKVAFG